MNRRDILFRGKRVDNGEWVYGSLVTGAFVKSSSGQDIPYIFNTDECDTADCFEDFTDDYGYYEVDPSTIGQFTGLTDKNGVKIWEGDRLRIPADLWISGQSVGKNKGAFNDDAFVEYHGGSFRINQIGNDAKLYYGVIDFSRNTGADVAEVIGTIHDTHLTKQS